jgi:dihydropteroate synthase
VLDEVQRYLADRILACRFAGIDPQRLLADPGFGFGKRLEHNLALLGGLRRLQSLRVPLLVGLSRKSMLGQISGRSDPLQRVHASVAAALWAVEQGAAIVRVHDVAATRDALAVWMAVQPYRAQSTASAPRSNARRDDDPL